jgi:hypothetical protein
MPIETRPIDTRCYRAALWLCPGPFRREYADEMARDFAEMRDEAAGERALWGLRLITAIDLVRTAGVQWLRTGLPAIALAALAIPLALAGALASLARQVAVPIPADPAQEEVLGILLLVLISLSLIAATMVLTLWFGPSLRRSPR